MEKQILKIKKFKHLNLKEEMCFFGKVKEQENMKFIPSIQMQVMELRLILILMKKMVVPCLLIIQVFVD